MWFGCGRGVGVTKTKQISRRPWSSTSVRQTVGFGIGDGSGVAVAHPSDTRAIGISRIGSSRDLGDRVMNRVTVKVNNRRAETVGIVLRDSNVDRL